MENRGFFLVRHFGNWLGFNIHGVLFSFSSYVCVLFCFQETSYFLEYLFFIYVFMSCFFFFFFF